MDKTASNENLCGEDATAGYVWCGKVGHACEEHARGIKALGAVIGYNVVLLKPEEGAKCQQVVNPPHED